MCLSQVTFSANQLQTASSDDRSQDIPRSNQECMPHYDLFLQFQKSRDKNIRDQLITKNLNLVSKLAKRYVNRGMALENLISVGTMGLIKAVDNYDLDKEVKFSTYAAHCILGEIKRAFRDTSWKLKVPRGLKELNCTVQTAITKLSQDLKRSPTVEEISSHLDIPQEKIIEAIEVSRAYNPLSLDASLNNNEDENTSLHDILSAQDTNLEEILSRYDLDNTMQKLENRERMIIQLFYYRGLSQAKIAERLGLSQMHVSRLLRQALRTLKELLS